MAFTPWFGTGFELGGLMFRLYSNVSLNSNASYVKTGTYSLKSDPGEWVDVEIEEHSSAYVDVGSYVYPDIFDRHRIIAYTTDGSTIEIRLSNSGYWDAYVDEVLVASGTRGVTADAYHNIQVRFHVDNSGYIRTRIDGVDDISYSGDTQPDTDTTIEKVRFYYDTGGIVSGYWDDITVGTGGWPGDIRYDGLMPDGDDSVEWTPSAGDNYAAVDEVPYSDADYVSAGSPDLTDIYTMEDWSGSNKSPQFLVAWARAKKDAAEPRTLELVVSSGGSESSSGSFNVATTFTYYDHIFETDPDGSAWSDTTIDALKAGIRSG